MPVVVGLIVYVFFSDWCTSTLFHWLLASTSWLTHSHIRRTTVLKGTVRLWNVEDGSCERTLNAKSPVLAVAFSPDSHFVVSVATDCTVRLWDVATGVCVRNFDNCKVQATSVDFSPDGKYVVLGSFDKSVRLLMQT